MSEYVNETLEVGDVKATDACEYCNTPKSETRLLDRGCKWCRASDQHRSMTSYGMAKLTAKMDAMARGEKYDDL